MPYRWNKLKNNIFCLGRGQLFVLVINAPDTAVWYIKDEYNEKIVAQGVSPDLSYAKLLAERTLKEVQVRYPSCRRLLEIEKLLGKGIRPPGVRNSYESTRRSSQKDS